MYNYKKQTFDWELGELDQVSKIRWKVLLEKEGDLEEACPWFKCTDYFNDVVVRNMKSCYCINPYGFDNTDMVVTGDLFVAIKSFGNKALFLANLDFVNKFLQTEIGWNEVPSIQTGIHDVPSNSIVLRIPRFYIECTAYISFLSALIRACTYGEELKYEEQLYLLESKLNGIQDSVYKKLLSLENKEVLTSRSWYGGVERKGGWDHWKGVFEPVVVVKEYWGEPKPETSQYDISMYAHNFGFMSWVEHAHKIEGLVL
jgi:hypothetical protein